MDTNTAKKLRDKISHTKVAVKVVDGESQTLNSDSLRQYARGDITLAMALGVSGQQAYGIAQLGYLMIQQNRLDNALKIFDGLIVLNPYDGYFHTAKAVILARQGSFDKALNEYTVAINLGFVTPQNLVSRAELYLRDGKSLEALADLKKAIELEPDAKKPSAKRAKILLSATKTQMQQVLAKKTKAL